MATDLSTVTDHPARIITDNFKPEFHAPADYLRAHEDEHQVTFAALDNVTLAGVREAYEQVAAAPLHSLDRERALETLYSYVGDLLGLND